MLELVAAPIAAVLALFGYIVVADPQSVHLESISSPPTLAAEGYTAPSTRAQVSIAKGAGGHYWVAGSVNGQSVQFMVDTGATSIAMNDSQARALNIDYRVVGQPMVVSTASGTERAWRIRLDSVKIGALTVLGVEGVVLEGGSPTQALLGMSFLSRVSWREEQGVLILESKL